MYTQTHTQKCTHMCTCTYHTDVYSHTHAPQMYSHGNAYSCTHLYHTPHRCILTKNSCTHSHTCFTHHRCTFALTHVHTLTHKCMYTQHITHHTLCYIHKCTHMLTHTYHIAQTYTHTHCNMHCTLTTHTNTLTLTRVHSHVAARHPVGSRAPCLGAVAKLPSSGLVGPLGAQPAPSLCKPASSSPGTPPRALGTRGLCVGPQGRPLGLRCPGASDRPAPSAWSSRLAAPP